MKNAQALLTSRIVLMGTMPYLGVPQLRDGKSVGKLCASCEDARQDWLSSSVEEDISTPTTYRAA